ncbi:flavodoxin family protein [Candidatus Bipolaricaulota bacterium]
MNDSIQLLILVGSPRRSGNSAFLATRAADAARASGASVELLFLQDLDIRPCEGCDVCRETVDAECILEDDMTGLYPKLREADAILIATPIYSYDMTAQTKLLIDRLYALGSRDGNALQGKRFGFIIVYGAREQFGSGAATAMRCFYDTFARKSSWMRIVHGSAHAAGDAAKNERLTEEATCLGADLVAVPSQTP